MANGMKTGNLRGIGMNDDIGGICIGGLIIITFGGIGID